MVYLPWIIAGAMILAILGAAEWMHRQDKSRRKEIYRRKNNEIL